MTDIPQALRYHANLIPERDWYKRALFRHAADTIEALRVAVDSDQLAWMTDARDQLANERDEARTEVARLRDAERHARMDANLHWVALVEARAEVARLRDLVASDVDFERIRADGYQREVARLRDALAFYADAANWNENVRPARISDAQLERGSRARAALGEGT